MARQDFINAEELIQRLNSAFDTHTKVIAQSAEQVKKYQAEFNKLPSGYIKAQKELLDLSYKQAKAEKELENTRAAKIRADQQGVSLQIKEIQQKKELLKLSDAQEKQSNKAVSAKNKEIATAAKKIQSSEKERLAEIKLQKERERAFDKYEAGVKKEAAALARSETAYNRIQASVSLLTKTYQDLAIRKQLGSTLTVKEEAQLLSVTNRINMYQTALKKVDADIQKHQRNVGNYASGFNGLSHSINQLTREAPAFANSVQTGFLALSNNIPMLFDEITKIKTANAELIAQGQPVKSVFSQLGAAVFSLGTALSLGVTLLTIYGDEITEWVGTLFKGSSAVDSFKESKKALGEISKEAAKSIVKERLELQTNLAVARDTTLSLKDREIAAQNVLDQYPYWFDNLGKEAIMNGDVEAAVRGVTDALLARAKANAAESKITENYSKIIDLETQLDEVITKRKADEARLNTLLELQRQGNLKDVNSILIAEREVRAGYAEGAKLFKELNALEEVNNNLSDYAIAQSKTAIGLDGEKAKAAQKAKEEEIQADTNSRVAFERNIAALEEQLSLINKEDVAYGALALQLKLLKDAYEAVYGEQEKVNDEAEIAIKFGTEEYYNDRINKLKEEQSQLAANTDEYALYNRMIKTVQDDLDALTGKTDHVKALNSAVQDYLKGISSGFLNDAKLGSLNFFLQLDENGQSTFDKLMAQAETTEEKFAVAFTAISEVAQEAFAFINQASAASFQAQYADLEQRQQIALKYAGESQAAQDEINRQYEERRKEIKRKELQAQKEQAIFNAIINTAQGVTAALAQANIPLSIIIGALGAAQIAFIAGQQIPAYKMGTDNHGGGLMMVNDASGSNYREMVQTPDGQSFIPQGRNVLMNAPKGTKVLTADKTMRELNEMLMTNDIAPFADVLMRDRFGGVVINQSGGGITKDDLDSVMAKYQNRKTFNLNLDKRGINSYWTGKDTLKRELDNSIKIKR